MTMPYKRDGSRSIKLDVRIDLKPDRAPDVSVYSIYSPLPAGFLEELATLVRKHSADHADYLRDPSNEDGIKSVRIE